MSENKKKVVVFDYGFGNVRSAERALAHVGADVEITRDFDRAMNADGLLVPGVGAFSACMDGLKKARGEWIIGRRLSGGRPVMGICVGMQILFERGIEHGVETEGLDEWPGTVAPLKAPVVPHMGWNTVRAPEDSQLFAGLDPEARFSTAATKGSPCVAQVTLGARIAGLVTSRLQVRTAYECTK